MTKIDHIGIAVRSLAQAEHFYSILGFEQHSPVQEIAREGVRLSMLLPDPARTAVPSIELLEPVADDSPVGRFLEKRGEGLHHIAFAVDNIAAVLEQAEQQGVRIAPGGIRQSPAGYSYFFIHPSSSGGVLIEICQAGAKPAAQEQ